MATSRNFSLQAATFRLLGIFAVLSGGPHGSVAQDNGDWARLRVKSGPVPPWVVPVAVPAPRTGSAEIPFGREYLLLESQVNRTTTESYHRSAYRLVNPQGVQDYSSFEVYFDPDYETLTLNVLTVRRGDTVEDRRPTCEVRIVPYQEAADAYQVDHRLVASVRLPDIRPGDVLEYAYTIRGLNPVFGRRWSREYAMSWGEALGRLYRRVLTPRPGELTWKLIGAELHPTSSVADGAADLRWQLDNQSAVLADDDLPAAFEAYAVLDLSEWPSWAAVAQWAAPLFASTTPLPAPLARQIETWQQLPTPGERAQAALRYVQDEFRYLALPMGPHSHQPYPLPLILERRYGDCKDKTLLLLSLLRALGLEADAALVSTSRRNGLANFLPSPELFDHVIVRLRLDGRDYWLDPTRSYQRGPLADTYLPAYGLALLARADATALTPIQPGGHDKIGHLVRETVTVADFKSPVALTVETVATGRDADRKRAYFATADQARISKDYLNYYAGIYPKIETTAPLEIEDDPAGNRFVTREHYRVADYWAPGTGSFDPQRSYAHFRAREIESALDEPQTRLRTMPFALSHPARMEHEWVLRLPRKLEINPDHVKVGSLYFDYESRLYWRDNDLVSNYQYRTLADEVPAREAADYQAKLKDILDDLNLTVAAPSEPANAEAAATVPGPEAPPAPYFLAVVAVLALVVVVVSSVVCGAIYFWPAGARRIPPPLPGPPELTGLRGWLVLLEIGALLTPVLYVWFFVENVGIYFRDDAWWLTEPAAEGAWPLRIFFGISTLYFPALMPLAILKAVLLFQKRRRFPAVYILWRACSLGYGLVILALLSMLQNAGHDFGGANTISPLVGELLAAVIWVAYVLRSERMRWTFIR